MVTDLDVLVADEAWIALASLHRKHPKRQSFSAAEIMESAKREGSPGVAGRFAASYLSS